MKSVILNFRFDKNLVKILDKKAEEFSFTRSDILKLAMFDFIINNIDTTQINNIDLLEYTKICKMDMLRYVVSKSRQHMISRELFGYRARMDILKVMKLTRYKKYTNEQLKPIIENMIHQRIEEAKFYINSEPLIKELEELKIELNERLPEFRTIIENDMLEKSEDILLMNKIKTIEAK